MVKIVPILLALLVCVSCRPREIEAPCECENIKPPTPYKIPIPHYLRMVKQEFEKDTVLTVEGIALGRKLFYEKRLSGDNSMSCASCHKQENAFSDPDRFSTGIDGLQGDRNAMAIVNLIFTKDLFWDGRADFLEGQALGPVVNPIEMHDTWPNVASKIGADEEYRQMFFAAFGCDVEIDSISIARAIAQFERTLVSFQSTYDDELNGHYSMTESEYNGYEIFRTERGDCFHCHPIEIFTTTDNLFHNNGMDSVFTDLGLEKVTGNPLDRGKFRTPTLRNIEFTAPYMHDGRFKTLEEVIEHYSSGLVKSSTIDPLMKKIDKGGLRLTTQEKKDLLAFLKLFSDEKFIKNEAFSDPNKK